MSFWLIVVLVSWGVSTINSVVMEAYFARRVKEEVGDYDPDMEGGPTHVRT